MQVEIVRASVPLERDDEHQLSDLATEVQVHKVKRTENPEEEDAFEHARTGEELLWLQKGKITVYRVVESETGEISQQVPSGEVVRVAPKVEEFLIFDETEKGSRV